MNNNTYALRLIAIAGLLLGAVAAIWAGVAYATAANNVDGLEPDAAGEAGSFPWLIAGISIFVLGTFALLFWLHAASVADELEVLGQVLSRKHEPARSAAPQQPERPRDDNILPGRAPASKAPDAIE
jgi:hypothetical protein